MVSAPDSRVAALILAGGGATRLGGGDKPLRIVGGRTILARIIDTLRPQVTRIAINANGDPTRLERFGLPVVADDAPSRGPLSGVLAGLDWLAREDGDSRLLTVAGDTPFLPADLAGRLSAVPADSIGVARSGGRHHPVFAVWPTSVRAELRKFLETSPTYSVAAFQATRDTVEVDFPMRHAAGREVDPFFNVNTPADLAAAETIAQILAP